MSVFSCVNHRQCGLAGVMPQRTQSFQSYFKKMELPSWVRQFLSTGHCFCIYTNSLHWFMLIYYFLFFFLLLRTPKSGYVGSR